MYFDLLFFQFISHDAHDGEENADWDEWFDDFVVAAAKDEPGIPEEAVEHQEAEDVESEDGDEDGIHGPRTGGTQRDGSGGEPPSKPGVRAASIASSYWRPEREDRKGELSGLDDRFDKLATQVGA
jgi:hypothetical protein